MTIATAGSPNAEKRPAASRSILHGATLLVVGRYGVALLGWLGTAIIVRELTRDEWGDFTLVLGLLGIVGLIADLRLSRIVLRELIDAPEATAELLGSYVALRIAIGVVSYLIAMVVVVIAYPAAIVRDTAAAGLSLVILSGASALMLLFEARYWMRSIAASQIAAQVVQLGATVAIAVAGIGSVLNFIWATVASSVITLLWLLWSMRHVARIRLQIDLARWKEWAKEAAPLAIGAALGTIYFRIDIVMLSMLKGSAAVGTYGVGYKFSDLIGSLPLSITTPAMTMMVAAWPGDGAAFRRAFRHSLVLLTVAAVGVTVGFVVFAEPLIRTLYTARYTDAVHSARLLVAGQALHFFTALCFITLVSTRRNVLYPIATLVGALLNIGLNLLLIPQFSYNGSGWATLVTEVAVLVVLGVGTARIPEVQGFPWRPIGVCAVAGGLAVVAGFAASEAIPWPAAALLCVAVYLGTLHVLRIDGPGGLRTLAREGRVPAEEPAPGAAPGVEEVEGTVEAADDLGLTRRLPD